VSKSVDDRHQYRSVIARGLATWYPFPDIHRAIMGGKDAIRVTWSAERSVLANHPAGKPWTVEVELSILQGVTINLATASDHHDWARDYMTNALGPEAQ
jgi:hypothetical protein